ncbi:siderophore-interacting protein [Plantactinospora sp. GCM10030261]|uniref:siderophore-interacting protein n=1 Tax=Plantactinospora sp. GCM10030261 TaxID=3273420 RepID=UPI00361F8DC4
MGIAEPTTLPWRLFDVEVRRLTRIGPSFLRVTFTGADLDRLADNGFDQRIKLVFPLARHGFRHLPTGPDWYARWRELPAERRNPFRTYTVRAVRPAVAELDVDMVLHGDAGPASRWAGAASPGDRLMVLGPNADHAGDHGGREFRPPVPGGVTLLAGDETAVPAIAAILGRLPATARGAALLEVPHPGDILDLPAPPGMTITWLPRGAGRHGSRLVPAVQAATARLLPEPSAPATVPVMAVSGSAAASAAAGEEPLWEVPDTPASLGCAAWLAGEAGMVRELRRHLVGERGLDRRSVAFMGYWRRGRSEDG